VRVIFMMVPFGSVWGSFAFTPDKSDDPGTSRTFFQEFLEIPKIARQQEKST